MNFNFVVSEKFDEVAIRQVYSSEVVIRNAWPSASFPLVSKQWHDWFTKVGSKKYSITMLINGKAIGHLVILKYLEAPYKCYICFVAIENSFQGQGLGKRLMLEAESYSRQFLEVDSMNLIVEACNYKALRLYKSIGYTIVQRGEKLRLTKSLVDLSCSF